MTDRGTRSIDVVDVQFGGFDPHTRQGRAALAGLLEVIGKGSPLAEDLAAQIGLSVLWGYEHDVDNVLAGCEEQFRPAEAQSGQPPVEGDV
jgi:hypothetical protein